MIIVFLGLNLFQGIAQENTHYDTIALEEIFLTAHNDKIPFKSILEKYKGQFIFIDIWASWCSDCVGSMPQLKKLQKKHNDVAYVMLSLDKNVASWQKGIKKHKLKKADHYLFTKKWKESPFCKSIKLDWIPRYMIVDKQGRIAMYKAIKLDNKQIQTILK